MKKSNTIYLNNLLRIKKNINSIIIYSLSMDYTLRAFLYFYHIKDLFNFLKNINKHTIFKYNNQTIILDSIVISYSVKYNNNEYESMINLDLSFILPESCYKCYIECKYTDQTLSKNISNYSQTPQIYIFECRYDKQTKLITDVTKYLGVCDFISVNYNIDCGTFYSFILSVFNIEREKRAIHTQTYEYILLKMDNMILIINETDNGYHYSIYDNNKNDISNMLNFMDMLIALDSV